MGFNREDARFIGEALSLVGRAIDLASRESSHDQPIPTSRTLSNEEAEKLRRTILRETWDENRMKILHIALKDAKVTCLQANCIVKAFTFKQGEAGKWLVQNGKLSDVHNVGDLVKGLMMWHRDEILGALD